jgi:ribosome maturation factor RimP
MREKVGESSTFFFRRRGKGALGRRSVYRDIPEEMRVMIEPIVDGHGLELVDVDLKRGRGPWTLRVIVDTPEGDGRVSVEGCAEVSREIGIHLDAGDWIPARYTLEVSSPGLDRVLAREKDFAAARGREVRIETRAPRNGRRRFRGRLLGFEAEVARLLVDGEEVEIAFADVARANAVYEFTREDFAKRASR